MNSAGPEDRTTFFAEQRRNRRAARIAGFFCILAIFLMCVACSFVLVPFLMAGVSILGEVLGRIVGVPGFKELQRIAADWLDMMQSGDLRRVAFFYVTLIAPGVLGTLGLWFPLRAMFRHVGLGALLWQQTRKPVSGNLEEQQLGNVVSELALAAGIPTPELGLLDRATASAAAIVGTSHKDCNVVATHSALLVMDRRQTQGLVSHLVASAANGDIELALSIRAVFHAFGLLTATFDIPFSKPARQAWLAFVKLFLSPSAQRDPQRVEEVSVLLLECTDPDTLESMNPENYGCFQWILFYACMFPMVLGRLLTFLVLLIVKAVFIGPLLGTIWRKRKYLADATSVQLTRDPSALAEALVILKGRPDKHRAPAKDDAARQVHGVDPWTSLGFVVGSTESDSKLAKQMGVLASFFPTINERLRRLIAQGAKIDYTLYKESSSVPCLIGCLLVVGVFIFLAFKFGS